MPLCSLADMCWSSFHSLLTWNRTHPLRRPWNNPSALKPRWAQQTFLKCPNGGGSTLHPPYINNSQKWANIPQTPFSPVPLNWLAGCLYFSLVPLSTCPLMDTDSSSPFFPDSSTKPIFKSLHVNEILLPLLTQPMRSSSNKGCTEETPSLEGFIPGHFCDFTSTPGNS